MITKTDLIKMARHVARRGSGQRDRRIMHPARDWLIGLFLTTVLFIGVSVGTGYMFLQKSGITAESFRTEVDVATYDQRRADRVLEQFTERSTQFEALRANRIDLSPDGEAGDTTSSDVAEDASLQVE